MTTNVIILLTMNLLLMCNAYFESPLIRLEGRSGQPISVFNRAVAVLNVSEPVNWADLMGPTNTSGSYGRANIGMSTVDSTVAEWSLPEQFRTEAVKSVKLLVSASVEGSLVAQAFVFDIPAGTSLTTLIVAATKLKSPADPNLSYAVNYVTINTNAQLKQQDPMWSRCFRCSDCLWTHDCCCKTYGSNRGHTPEELQAVKQKMTADQFKWFSQQNISSDASKILTKRTVTSIDNQDQDNRMLDAVEKFLSSKTTKAEVLAPYNDSILTAIQSNITSLKLSTQALKLKGIERNNMITLLNTLAEEHGFENIYLKPQYAQQLESLQFSYEHLFTSKTSTNKSDLAIKHIWIIGQLINNSTYMLNFLIGNMTSKSLLKAILFNNTENGIKRVDIVRTSTLTPDGEFINEDLQTMITPWPQKQRKWS